MNRINVACQMLFFQNLKSYIAIKIVRILKKKAQEMSRSRKVSRTFEFLRIFGAAEKSQGAAEKNTEKVEATCTGFSVEFFVLSQ